MKKTQWSTARRHKLAREIRATYATTDTDWRDWMRLVLNMPDEWLDRNAESFIKE